MLHSQLNDFKNSNVTFKEYEQQIQVLESQYPHSVNELEKQLEHKSKLLDQANAKLIEVKSQFASLLANNESVQKSLSKREAMINEALKRLSILSVPSKNSNTFSD